MPKAFNITVQRPFLIDLRIVRDYGRPEWEVYFDGPEPSALMQCHCIADQVARLWNVEHDPDGVVAAELFTYLKNMAQKGTSVKDLFKFAEKFADNFAKKVYRDEEKIERAKWRAAESARRSKYQYN